MGCTCDSGKKLARYLAPVVLFDSPCSLFWFLYNESAQVSWRRNLTMSKYVALVKKHSATRIQSFARSWMVRSEISKLSTAAVPVQSLWRRYKARAFCLMMLRLQTLSASRIQRQWRLYSGGQKRFVHSVCRIQTAWRALNCTKSYRKARMGVIVSQAVFRRFLAVRSFVISIRASILIQVSLYSSLGAPLFMICGPAFDV